MPTKREMKVAALPDEAKDFAVLCFAKFMTPTQVAEATNDRFGTSIDRRQAQRYDPTSKLGAKQLGKKRKQLFEAARKRFLDDLNDIPIANKAMRLQQLQAHYDKVLSGHSLNLGMALKIIEQAAKEAEGFHSSERTVNLRGKVQVEDVSEDEIRGGIASAIAAALEAEQERLKPPSMTKH